MVIDRDIDAIMERTKRRPLVTGIMSARDATLFAIGLEVVAFVVLALWVNQLSAWLALSATAFYFFIYTMWLKRRSKQNIVIGGAAGAVPVLIGWAAVTNSLTWTPVLLFLVIFIWTPPHFWALAVRYRDDYEAANVPMMPVVTSLRHTTLEILIYSVVMWALTVLIARPRTSVSSTRSRPRYSADCSRSTPRDSTDTRWSTRPTSARRCVCSTFPSRT